MNWEGISDTESRASGSRYWYVCKIGGNGLWNARQYWGGQMLKSTWLKDQEKAQAQCQKWEDISNLAQQIPTTGRVSETPEE